MKIKHIILCMATMLGATATVHAQTYNDTVRTNTWSVYVQGGVGGYGDMRGEQFVGKKYIAPNAAIGVKYNIRPWVRMGLNVGWTYLKDADKGTVTSTTTTPNYQVNGRTGTLETVGVRLQNRNMTQMLGADLNIDLNIMDIWHNRRAQKFNLWVGAGAGFMKGWNTYSNTWAFDANCVAQGNDHMNIYSHSWIESDQVKHNPSGLYIPLSLSAEWDLAPKWTLGVIGQYKILPQERSYMPKSMWDAGLVLRYNFVGKKQGIYSNKSKYLKALAALDAARMAQENCEKSSANLQRMLDEANAKNRALMADNAKLKNQPAPEPVVLEGGLVYFQNASSELTPEGQQVVNRVAKAMKELNGKQVMLIGSANTPGSTTLNMRLSKQRVQTVKEALLSAGVSESQIAETYAVGEYGMTADEACRRVVIVVK